MNGEEVADGGLSCETRVAEAEGKRLDCSSGSCGRRPVLHPSRLSSGPRRPLLASSSGHCSPQLPLPLAGGHSLPVPHCSPFSPRRRRALLPLSSCRAGRRRWHLRRHGEQFSWIRMFSWVPGAGEQGAA